MSFFTKISNWFRTTEADVVKIVIAINKDVAVAEKDINTASKWIASNAPKIANEIQVVLGLVTSLGVTANPEVAAAVVAANVAVAALNNYATLTNNGANNTTATQAVVDGYIAVKQAQASVASAAAAAAKKV